MPPPATDADFSSRTSPSRLPDETWLQQETARPTEISANLINAILPTPATDRDASRHHRNSDRTFPKEGRPANADNTAFGQTLFRPTQTSYVARTRIAADPSSSVEGALVRSHGDREILRVRS